MVSLQFHLRCKLLPTPGDMGDTPELSLKRRNFNLFLMKYLLTFRLITGRQEFGAIIDGHEFSSTNSSTSTYPSYHLLLLQMNSNRDSHSRQSLTWRDICTSVSSQFRRPTRMTSRRRQRPSSRGSNRCGVPATFPTRGGWWSDRCGGGGTHLDD